MIDGKTKTCGLLGYPVEHTLSPLIHNTIAEAMGHNLEYLPFLVGEDRVKEAVEGAAALSIHGLNVTVPHKQAVIPYLMDIDPLAQKIGAVNTLVPQYREDGTVAGFKGYNTDMTGLSRAMQKEGMTIQDKDAILLGAGGAARAVAFMLASQGAKSVHILNRSVDKAQAIADEVNTAMEFDTPLIFASALSDFAKLAGKQYLCIQCTSVGLHPHNDQVVIEDPAFYQMIDEAVDIIYKPANTRFMQLCKAAGVTKVCNGLGMLLYQGIDAYELWNQVHVEDALCDRIYELMKEKTKVEE